MLIDPPRGGASVIPSPTSWLRQRALAIPNAEVTFERRGFVGRDLRTRLHLEALAGVVLDGYRAALRADEPDALRSALESVDLERRGFAFEGAAMAMALLDRLTPRPPWRAPGRFPRWTSFLGEVGSAHAYMIHIGAGLALARMRSKLVLPGRDFDPLLCWLVADGYGFHEGFFRWRESSHGRAVAGRVEGYARRAIDQGFGRSLWFVCGADPPRIDAAIRDLSPDRWTDLWSGVGLACAYAGGIERAEIESLRNLSERFAPELAQGAAFAAQARERAGNPAPHTDLACRILCDCDASRAAEATVHALQDLPLDAAIPSFEVWRRRLHVRFGAREVA